MRLLMRCVKIFWRTSIPSRALIGLVERVLVSLLLFFRLMPPAIFLSIWHHRRSRNLILALAQSRLSMHFLRFIDEACLARALLDQSTRPLQKNATIEA